MIYIDISRKKIHKGTISASSGESDPQSSAQNLVKPSGVWCTKKHNSIAMDFAIVDYGEVVPVNFIEVAPSPSGSDAFPESFRIEGSSDGVTWGTIHYERSYDSQQAEPFRVELPLAFFRYLKLLIIRPKNINKKYYSEIGALSAGIAGFKTITASSSSSYQHDISKVVDNIDHTFWESELESKNADEKIDIDLGNIYHINRIILKAAPLEDHCFPENFILELSTDLNIWQTVLSEKAFIAEPGGHYFWEIAATPARYLRLEMERKKAGSGNIPLRIASLEVAAAHVNPYHTHNIGDITPYASVFSAGIVRLAHDGEDAMGTAVQGNDHRLRDASVIFKGIVRLANHGESGEGLAVQASDPRIHPASEVREGIVRLAYDRENKAGAVVQGNDSRLQEATAQSYGIVKLCPDNVYSENAVIVGNDSRLQRATTAAFGICRLAENGENAPECVVQGNDRRLRDATTLYKGIVELAEDGEDREGVVVQGNDRRIKDATTLSKGIVELAENGEDRERVVVQGNDRRLKDATTSAKGIVELAEDGEDREGVAVQGNDRRLKDATELTKGILRFARDGESSPCAAVQGNDRRLKDATTTAKGIVELAEDGEDQEGVAVQGNDRRLKDATTSNKGIVELAEDGEDREGVVVQGNDRRLKEADARRHGIVRFAEDGESSPLAAVQGNDRRLKDATTTAKGIVELAEDGEDREGVAVQGSDRRLKEATTSTKGIVELAEDGENREGVAVQGNDRRLQAATVENSGIVRLAKNGEKREGLAVQANDERLFDARNPLPHEHDYAASLHEHNSHAGTLAIIAQKENPYSGILPPPDAMAVVYARNESKHPGAAGVAGVASSYSDEKKIHQYGILGHSQFVGVRGQSSGHEEGKDKGCGVLGVSRFGPGGVFASEHSFSLVADGFGSIDDFDSSCQLKGNGEALLVKGQSEFHGRINIYNNAGSFPAGLVELFEVDDEEYLAEGDLLVASPRGNGILSRCRTPYDRGVVGIVSGNPALIFNNASEAVKKYPVVLAGKALVRADARKRKIKPGDLIVASDTPGCGMAGEIKGAEAIGTVIAKSLDSLDDGIGLIHAFVFHA